MRRWVDPGEVRLVVNGREGGSDYRVFFESGGRRVSPWHDLPVRGEGEDEGVCNMVCEMPRGSTHKMEICTKEAHNPIRQDVKNGKLRHLLHVGCQGGKPGVLFNYGAIPQTWEDPSVAGAHAPEGLPGDNDPVDVIDVGCSRRRSRGDVVKVRVLGSLALIDEGETDWKVLAVDVTDPLARRLWDSETLTKELPGTVDAIREWYRVYKVSEGKKPNRYGFNGRLISRDVTLDVLHDSHRQWQSLITGSSKFKGTSSFSLERLLPL